ncbi:MAG TPA: type VII secretion protein EccB [Streptosporangiaceae bacterium]|nr:type VII secretion protein EccB [Streptosporangiaceae bacterium]
MYDRRDLLQAHRLVTHRMSQALLCGEPDSRNRPLRRMYTASASSLLLGVIAAGVFGVLGTLLPGHAAGLNQPGTLVVDTDTATAYVPCARGELCPAMNFASALLTLDSPGAIRRVTVRQAALAGYVIGPPVGIAGLPPSLPAASALVRGPWSVCAKGGATVLVGGVSTRGRKLGPSDAALVSAGGGEWLLWHSARLAIRPAVAQTLFGAGPVGVPLAWLDSLPRGPDFAAPALPGAGQTVTGPSGIPAPVGQVYVQQSPLQYYVLTAGGRLAAVTPLAAALLERVAGAQPGQPVSSSSAASDLGGTTVQTPGLPTTVPRLAGASPALCAVYRGGAGPVMTVGGVVPPGGATSGAVRAWFPPGGGALVRSAHGWLLLADAHRYPVGSAAAAQALGYGLGRDAVPLPASVTDLLAPGPALRITAKTPAP